jgi:hypothetical protein
MADWLLPVLFALLGAAYLFGVAVLVAPAVKRWWQAGLKQVDRSIEGAFNPLTDDVDPAADDPTAGLSFHQWEAVDADR